MNSEKPYSVAGLSFSKRFIREMHRRWEEISRESQNAVVDIQRTRRAGQNEPSENEWSAYFLMKTIFDSKDVVLVEGIPIHLIPKDRELLAGKLLDFENHRVVVR